MIKPHGMMKHTDVAIVIPYHKSELSADGQYSIRHLDAHLSEFPKFFALPEGINPPVSSFDVKYFDKKHFAGEKGYNQFLVKPNIYEAFSDFTYILIYQTDVIVFSNRLLEFCEMGYDYIGAPLISNKLDPNTQEPIGFLGGANGGFSLRKVNAFLKIFQSPICANGLNWQCLKRIFSHPYHDLVDDPYPLRIAKIANIARQLRKGSTHYMNDYKWHEDHFWGFRSHIFDPDFKIAPVSVGLDFAFERFPAYCLQQNDGKLPFGAHAWERYDRAFWEPHLIKPSDDNQ